MTDRRRIGVAIYLLAATAGTILLLATTDFSAREKTTRDWDMVDTQIDAPWYVHWDSLWRVGLAAFLVFTMIAVVEGYRRDEAPRWTGRVD